MAVSIAAGVAALTSIFPALFDIRVRGRRRLRRRCSCLGNLRGIRESGAIFAAPTYVYLVAIFGLLGYGFWSAPRPATLPELHAAGRVARERTAREALGLLLILRAFASGSVALTGTEAVSNGVPAFKPPEARNAQIVLILMGTSASASIFLGISFLAGQLGILPDPTEQETVSASSPARSSVRRRPFHYLVQISTALLLVLAANTAFADFPRLASILARDRFLPRMFQFRGDRLAFTGGIVVLAVVAVAADRRLPGQRHGSDPALHGRRLHRLHAQPGGHGRALVAAARHRARLALAGRDQRRRRGHDRRRGGRGRRRQVRARRLDGAGADPVADRA